MRCDAPNDDPAAGMLIWRRLAALIEAEGAATLVTVVGVRGSVPREAGARMIVGARGAFEGTIGGGTLEWRALAAAQGDLPPGGAPVHRDYPLGPKLGQCCGGAVTLAYQRFADLETACGYAAQEEADGLALRFAPTGTSVVGAADVIRAVREPDGALLQTFADTRTPLALFGAGHVGRAVIRALSPLPFRIVWIDQRDDAFPDDVTADAVRVSVENPAAWAAGGLASLGEGAFVLIMTHNHALDLALTDAALRARGPAYVGLIGSETKKARFTARLRAAGLDEGALSRMVCPIGLPALADKAPASIAASVAADLMIRRDAARSEPVKVARRA